MREEKELQRIIELARREVNRQNSPLALQYLLETKADVEMCEGTRLSAEHQLTLAETLASMRDREARSIAPAGFEEAITRICNLPERVPELELRAHEHLASFSRLNAFVLSLGPITRPQRK